MTDHHPITPPPELVKQWRKSGPADAAVNNAYEQHIATQAAQWGADQQLEMDAMWVALHRSRPMSARQLNADMRPDPLDLREQALAALAAADGADYPVPITVLSADTHALIRKALEAIE